MPNATDLQTVPDLTADAVRRIVTYTDELTYFGENSAALAIAKTIAEQTAQNGERLHRALLRRNTIVGASGTQLDEVLEEHGSSRLGPVRAQVPVILRPWSTTVTAITSGSRIEVDDATHFAAGASIRITNGDGTTSEILTVGSVDAGTGPNGGDELVVGTILGSYDPDGETVAVLLRKTVPAGTVLTSTAGIAFETLDDVTVGDSNPVLQGEATALALADKVWTEARTSGESGNVEALTIDGFAVDEPDVREVFNPVRAQAGADEERDLDAKLRATHMGQLAAQETTSALERLAATLDKDVIRAFAEDASDVSTLRLRVLTRAGGGLSQRRREALRVAMEARLRSRLGVEILNVEPVAIVVSATVALDPGAGTVQERLDAAGRAAADRLAIFLDWRKWEPETFVDEADLLGLVRGTPGIADVVTSTFAPADNTTIPAASVPMLVWVSLTDTTTGATFGAQLTTSY